MAQTLTGSYVIDDVEVSAREFRLTCNGQEKHLRRQAFQVLLYLIEHQHRAVGRDELIESVWHGAAVTDDSVGQCVSEIRDALGDNSRTRRFIRTLPKVGYQFIGTIRESPAVIADATSTEEPVVDGSEALGASSIPDLSHRSGVSSRALHWTALLLIAGGVVAGLIFGYRQHRLRVMFRPSVATATAAPRRSIAILGFANLANRPQDAWLSTALSDWYCTELAAGEQLRIVSPTVLKDLRGESLASSDELNASDLAQIRRVLGVDMVLSGSYAKLNTDAGGPIRIDLKIQDTRNGDTVYATSASGDQAHLFDLVSGTGKALRTEIEVPDVTHEQAEQVAATLPSDPVAERFYAEGVARLRVSDLSTARDLLLKAVAAAPQDPMPHAALASAWAQLGYDANAESEAKQALDLSSHLSRADHLLLLANYNEAKRNWSGAIQTYGALFTFFPDDLNRGLQLANAQVTAGRWTDAIATLDLLRRLPAPSDNDPRIDLQECRAVRSLGKMKEAAEWCMKAAQKAHTSGASLLEARALLDGADALRNIDDSEQAAKLAQGAGQLFAVARGQQGMAETTDFLAGIAEDHEDYQSAEEGYRKVLTVYEGMQFQPGIAGMHDNLGEVDLHRGNTSGALDQFNQALVIYRKIGEEDGMALAEFGLGDVYRVTGQHTKATASYHDSIAASRQTGNRNREAKALVGLSKELWDEGDLSGAYQNMIQAKVIFQQLGEGSKSPYLASELAGILLDEHRTIDSIRMANEAATAPRRPDQFSDVAAANLVLADAFLAENRLADAQKAFASVQPLTGQIHDRDFLWSIEMTEAKLKAISGNKDAFHSAESELRMVASQATSASYVHTALTAQLYLSEIQMPFSDTTSLRVQLSSLAKEASNRGLGQIADRARADLAMLRQK
jgi:DNA-binding winged helix-turn-helix (wHTH) protein/tetratricopeptide (TPR) repeat protein/TolB-like protein